MSRPAQVGQIQFHVAVGLRKPRSCWLSARGFSRLPQSLTHGPFIFKASNGRVSPSHTSNLADVPFCLISPAPKGSCDYRVNLDNLPLLKSADQ